MGSKGKKPKNRLDSVVDELAVAKDFAIRHAPSGKISDAHSKQLTAAQIKLVMRLHNRDLHTLMEIASRAAIDVPKAIAQSDADHKATPKEIAQDELRRMKESGRKSMKGTTGFEGYAGTMAAASEMKDKMESLKTEIHQIENFANDPAEKADFEMFQGEFNEAKKNLETFQDKVRQFEAAKQSGIKDAEGEQVTPGKVGLEQAYQALAKSAQNVAMSGGTGSAAGLLSAMNDMQRHSQEYLEAKKNKAGGLGDLKALYDDSFEKLIELSQGKVLSVDQCKAITKESAQALMKLRSEKASSAELFAAEKKLKSDHQKVLNAEKYWAALENYESVKLQEKEGNLLAKDMFMDVSNKEQRDTTDVALKAAVKEAADNVILFRKAIAERVAPLKSELGKLEDKFHEISRSAVMHVQHEAVTTREPMKWAIRQILDGAARTRDPESLPKVTNVDKNGNKRIGIDKDSLGNQVVVGTPITNDGVDLLFRLSKNPLVKASVKNWVVRGLELARGYGLLGLSRSAAPAAPAIPSTKTRVLKPVVTAEGALVKLKDSAKLLLK